MNDKQLPLPGMTVSQYGKVYFPVFAITNNQTGDYVEICHNSPATALNRLNWKPENCTCSKIGRSQQYNYIFVTRKGGG